MPETLDARIRRRFRLAALLLGAVLVVGTGGYWVIGGGAYSLLDCFYMVAITITTIGYGEVIDLSASPGGRVFTVLIAVGGIGTMTYIIMSLTAFVVEGELNAAFRRRRMDKLIDRLTGHYIVCGVHGVGAHIVRELRATGRPFVVVDLDEERARRLAAPGEEIATLAGDATDNDTLLRAGLARARGVFAVTGDDNVNLVISLSARQLNPAVRVVARCEDARNVEKMRQAGADAAVSPTRIGGLRIASEMLRPAVVNFLDVMLRHGDEALRVEEIAVPTGMAGRPLTALDLHRFRRMLLLAVRHADGWTYNPPRDYAMREGDVLVFMGSPEERRELERALGTVSS